MQAPSETAQPLLLEDYRCLPPDQLAERIGDVRARLGGQVLVLGHHYQADDIIRFADLRGDSLKLARLAGARKDCRTIVFCGVHFMAETADILTDESVAVVLPDLAAGCSLADFADADQVASCWAQLAQIGLADDLVPVTYVNSSAALKAFCGEHGGIVCTSSNAQAVLQWAWARKPRVLFFPDQHLGRNTAFAMGMPSDHTRVWDPSLPLGGHAADAWRSSRLVLWNGCCSVHQVFLADHVRAMRNRVPDIRIIVHPECCSEVVQLADLVGSTEFIIRAVGDAPAGTRWAVGTELNLVRRLRQEHPDQQIHFLSPLACRCATMARTDLPHLCWVLDNLLAGTVVNRVKVGAHVRHWAQVGLNRMLEVS